MSSTPTITKATTQIYDILEAYSPEDRQKVIQAAFALLGDKLPSSSSATPPTVASSPTLADNSDGSAQLFPAANRWISQNKLKVEMLEPYLHINGGEAAVIGLPPGGKSRADRTTAAYLLLGVASLFASGSPSFTDDAARQLCQEQGCYDPPNHAKTCKTFGNRLRGSKEKGWQLTAPGLTAAAELVRVIAE